MTKTKNLTIGTPNRLSTDNPLVNVSKMAKSRKSSNSAVSSALNSNEVNKENFRDKAKSFVSHKKIIQIGVPTSLSSDNLKSTISVPITNNFSSEQISRVHHKEPVTSKKCCECSKKCIIITVCVAVVLLIIIGVAVGLVTYFVIVSKNQNSSNTSSNVNIKVNLPGCGTSSVQPSITSINARIIGGNASVANSWPYIVSINYESPRGTYSNYCAGVLINQNTVLTAAHCTDPAVLSTKIGAPIPSIPKYASYTDMIRIYVGINNRSTDVNTDTLYYAANISENADFDSNTYANDISLIKLVRNVNASTNVNFICLDSSVTAVTNDQLVAIGWGYSSLNSIQSSDTLMQVQIPVVNQATCKTTYISNIQFCAGDTLNIKDTCSGDSGGPVMKYVNNAWFLVGIVSNGLTTCSGTGIYTNVTSYYNWILNNIN